MSTNQSNPTIDHLVKRYLVSRGFHEAANMLGLSEMQLTTSENSPISDDTISNAILIDKYQDKLCDTYFTSYEMFRLWAVNSLDCMKFELVPFCFPLFVHSYLSLIRKDFGERAREFWQLYEKGPPDLMMMYGTELRQLSQVVSKEQFEGGALPVEKSSFLHCALSTKFKVRISSVAYQLLTEFLSRDENLLLAAIINDKVDISHSNPPTDLVEKCQHNPLLAAFVPVTLPGYSPQALAIEPGDKAFTNKINLHVPGRTPATLQLDGVPVTMEPMGDRSIVHDKLLEAWTKVLVQPRLLLSRKRLKSSPGSAVDSQVTGGLDPTIDSAELRHAAVNPTVLFSTVANTYDSLICMNISNECRQVAAGFRDSSVCIWYLDEGDQSGYPGRLLGTQREHTLQTLPQYKPSSASSASKPPSDSSTSMPPSASTSSDRKENMFLQLRGHSKPVYGVSQDSSARFVLSASADETIRLWDTAVSQCVGKYTGISPFWDVAFGPLGYYFATANEDHCSFVYSTDRSQPLRILSGHVSDVTCVSWHDNGTRIATGSDDQTVRLWDLRSGSAVRLLQGCSSSIRCLACSHDGRLLAAGTDGGAAHVWDLYSGKALAILAGHNGPIYSIAFSEQTETIATGGRDCSVRVWSLENLVNTQPSTSQDSQSGTDGTRRVDAHPQMVLDNSFARAQYLLSPMHSYFTKFTPVFFLNYNSKNMLYAGGPFGLQYGVTM